MGLGPIQKEWVKSLREHPERQIEGQLGLKTEDGKDYKACCLGEGLCVLLRLEGLDPLLHFRSSDNLLLDNSEHNYLLDGTAKRLGLHNGRGALKDGSDGEEELRRITGSYSLSGTNDSGKMTWPEIADFIEKYPESVFTKSV